MVFQYLIDQVAEMIIKIDCSIIGEYKLKHNLSLKKNQKFLYNEYGVHTLTTVIPLYVVTGFRISL